MASTSSPSTAIAESLRDSSWRECSRLARKRMARARNEGCGLLMNAQAMTAKEFSVAFGRFDRDRHAARDAHRLADLLLDLLRHRRVLLEQLAPVVLALAALFALVGLPGAGLLDDAAVDPHLADLPFTADAPVS